MEEAEAAPSSRTAVVSQQGVEPEYVLRLRNPNRVHWCEDVVDNENMGKRSSKVCCIFHKPKAFGESDSESDSHDSSSSDSSSDESDAYDSDDEWRRQMRAPPPGGGNGAAAAAADPGRPGPAGSEDSAHGDAAGDGAPVHE